VNNTANQTEQGNKKNNTLPFGSSSSLRFLFLIDASENNLTFNVLVKESKLTNKIYFLHINIVSSSSGSNRSWADTVRGVSNGSVDEPPGVKNPSGQVEDDVGWETVKPRQR